MSDNLEQSFSDAFVFVRIIDYFTSYLGYGELSFNALLELRKLEYAKEKGLIQDFANFKEIDYGKEVSYDFIPVVPIKRLKITNGLMFNIFDNEDDK